jgi:hypothetical protein
MTKLKIYLFTIFAVFCTSSVKAQNDSVNGKFGNEEVFKIFQFPKNQIPRIDGKSDDWEMVPG